MRAPHLSEFAAPLHGTSRQTVLGAPCGTGVLWEQRVICNKFLISLYPRSARVVNFFNRKVCVSRETLPFFLSCFVLFVLLRVKTEPFSLFVCWVVAVLLKGLFFKIAAPSTVWFSFLCFARFCSAVARCPIRLA